MLPPCAFQVGIDCLQLEQPNQDSLVFKQEKKGKTMCSTYRHIYLKHNTVNQTPIVGRPVGKVKCLIVIRATAGIEVA